ncbi:Katanin p60 ATPase-containing subunit A-like 2 [Terramyces sp. JEL0728]|nr:Katanin p60 ATPase-containing subunit A-like 2 [Terramyces sp. JEL0728]
MHEQQLKEIIEWASSLPEISFAKVQLVHPLVTPVVRVPKLQVPKEMNLSNLCVNISTVIGPTGVSASGNVNCAEVFPIEFYSKEFHIVLVMKAANHTFHVDATKYLAAYLKMYGTDLLSKISIVRGLLDSLLAGDHFEADKLDQRKRNILVLILNHLLTFGYISSFEKLQLESNVSLKKIAVADNIDLMAILQEYESYYNIKFGKNPKFVRKSGEADMVEIKKKKFKERDMPTKPLIPPIAAKTNNMEAKTPPQLDTKPLKHASTELEAIGKKTGSTHREVLAPAAEQTGDPFDQKLLKPLPFYESSELKELANIITRDIHVKNPNVKWSDISGLEKSKRLIKEAIPPGTGKTMLAKAIATECKTTFFNISASSIVSKWRGDSEKLVRVLFELARHHAPSTIFIDELESIMSQRSSESEHEGSRRMKTELLMDGLAKTNEHVFLLAASNLPWDLDNAMLRRLEKRILIDLPELQARHDLFEKLLTSHHTSDGNQLVDDIDYNFLAKETEGYSGSDINLVCREAAMRPLRQIFDKLDSADSLSNGNLI